MKVIPPSLWPWMPLPVAVPREARPLQAAEKLPPGLNLLSTPLSAPSALASVFPWQKRLRQKAFSRAIPHGLAVRLLGLHARVGHSGLPDVRAEMFDTRAVGSRITRLSATRVMLMMVPASAAGCELPRRAPAGSADLRPLAVVALPALDRARGDRRGRPDAPEGSAFAHLHILLNDSSTSPRLALDGLAAANAATAIAIIPAPA
jgi:hypothetical protein